MLKSVLAAALAAGLVVALAAPGLAGSEIRLAQAAPSKPLTPQQQKMKDCAGKWQDEKAKTGVKGRAAYRKFMGDCLKKAPPERTPAIEAGQGSTGLSGPRPHGCTRHALIKIPRASARGRGCESIGKCYAAATYGDLPFPLSSLPPPSGDR